MLMCCATCKHADPVLFLDPIQIDCAKLGRRVDERHDGCGYWHSCKSRKERVIEHWHQMHDDAPGVYESRKEGPNIKNCAYCQRFWFSNCRGCPIAIVAGQIVCRNTPYADARAAWTRYKDSGWAEEHKADWQVHAAKMIEYLKGLPDEIA